MADFIFRMESVQLTDTQQKRIAAAIRGAVLTELAQLDLAAEPSAPDCLFVPISWVGGWLISPEVVPKASRTKLSITAT
jgi:hypothetical protein